jgi:hypothetical protein
MLSSVRALLDERPWAGEVLAAVVWLLVGIALLPVLIFYVGTWTLGRYEGGSLPHLYASLGAGLQEGSLAPWVVFLGPYALFLLFRALRLWWRASARFA